jgi:putative membrane protein
MFGLFGPSPAQRAAAFVVDWLILALAVWLAAEILQGIRLEGLKSVLAVAGILGLLNALVKPFLRAVTLPLTLLTLGLFIVLINTALFGVTEWIADKIGGIDFSIDGFWDALLGALIISLVTFLVSRLVDSKRIARDLAPRGF